MYIARVELDAFRNLTCGINLTPGLSVVIGENNIGKSNLIDALRIVLLAQPGPREQLWLRPDDFAHDARGTPVSDTLSVSVIFRDLSLDARAQMLTCLAPSIAPDAARLTLRAQLRPSRSPTIEWTGGDTENTDIEQWARAAARYTYLPPLRDAQADLRPGRANRLVLLLAAIAGEGPDREAMEQVVTEANLRLADIDTIKKAKNQIQTRLDEMTGPGYGQQIDLAFSEPQFDRIAGALRALIGTGEPLEMVESGLGFTNLLYMATLLASLSEEQEAPLHLLLIEEPEAHLHPQLQDLLMRYLERSSTGGIQIVATSHSPNFASSAGVDRITILSRPQSEGAVVGRSAAEFGLTADELDTYSDSST